MRPLRSGGEGTTGIFRLTPDRRLGYRRRTEMTRTYPFIDPA
jgi:hypothetical protein